MAIVSPFRALQYDARKVGGLERVLTQPYDKITPEMQKDYLRRSPYNLAHITKGEVKDGDSPQNNVYTRAAALFHRWREEGVLIQRQRPAFYSYYQQFDVPGTVESPPLVRKGFIGLGKLEDYDSGVVFRHEQTLAGPKADRLELLRATRAHFEQIFLLYSDPERTVERLMDEAAAGPPALQVTDDYGVVHSLWEIDDPEKIRVLQNFMLDRRLIIADGHHRYDTALNFQRECRASRPHDGETECAYATMTFVNMDSEGMVILPTHRLVAGLPGFARDEFLSRAGRYFDAVEFPFSNWEQRQGAAKKMRAEMASAAQGGVAAIGVLLQGHSAFTLLRLQQDIRLEALLPELSPAQRSLDVTMLHRIAFALCLGMDEESVRRERFLSYIRDFEEGVVTVLQGKAQACFFLNPVRIEQVRAIAFEGRCLPQKSTDFYPKLLSGLAVYVLES